MPALNNQSIYAYQQTICDLLATIAQLYLADIMLCLHIAVFTPLNTLTAPSPSALNLLKWRDEQGQEQTFRLVDRVGAKWVEFGVLLGLSKNQLDAVKEDQLGQTARCWNRVMEDHWLGGCSSEQYPPTWEGLYTLLTDMESANIARDLKEAVNRASM